MTTVNAGRDKCRAELPAEVTGASRLLDYADSLCLKGLAITAIVLHNYYHLLLPVKENEFEFNPERLWTFLGAVVDPRYSFQALFAFVGHFGVQIFIFISAYGLSLKYRHLRGVPVRFVLGRVRKLYPAFIAAIAMWALIGGISSGAYGPLLLLRQNLSALLLTAVPVINFVPGQGLPPVGPWWFIPFIIQLYLLWPSLNRFTDKFRLPGLALLALSSILLTMLGNVYLERFSINLLESPIGHMPEICLGIAAGRYGIRLTHSLSALAALCLFVASNLFEQVWLLSFPSALVLGLWLYSAGRRWLGSTHVWSQLGRCSMALFLVNGVIRLPFLAFATNAGWGSGLVLGLVSGAASAGVAWFLTQPAMGPSRQPAP